MDKLENVKVGDILLVKGGCKKWFERVTRVTKTMAFTTKHSFKKNCSQMFYWPTARKAVKQDVCLARDVLLNPLKYPEYYLDYEYCSIPELEELIKEIDV